MDNQHISLHDYLYDPSLNSRQLPKELPVAHLTRDEWLINVIHDGVLRPQVHSVYDKERKIIFLTYGGLFYRSSLTPTKDRLQAPIAFVFHPKILNFAKKYYPFDTGMIKKKIGVSWTKTLEPIELKYEINGFGDRLIPRKIVQYLFGSNENYLQGIPDEKREFEKSPIQELYNFYVADLTRPDISDERFEGIDRRQCVIECQFDKEISVFDNLMWIGMPDQDYELFEYLYERHSDPISLKVYTYNFTNIFRPNEIEKELEDAARKDIVEKILMHEKRLAKNVQPTI